MDNPFKINNNNPSPCNESKVMTYGYARVSSAEQNEDRQLRSLRQAGVQDSNIFTDHKSGKDFNRPAWRKLIKRLHRGDRLVITSLDRLGRNYEEMQTVWNNLTKRKGIDVQILDMPFFKSVKGEGLTESFLADLFFKVLAYVAQMEREHIHTRQKEGIAAAHLRGVKFGRPRVNLPDNFEMLVEQVQQHTLSLRTASQLCGVSVSTFRRRMHIIPQ